jgi:hypothetical protein
MRGGGEEEGFLAFFWPKFTKNVTGEGSKFEKIFDFFFDKGTPFGQNVPNFFLNQIRQFIHQSKALVKFSRNMLLPNFF